MNEWIVLLEIILPALFGIPLITVRFRDKEKEKMMIYVTLLFALLIFLNIFAYYGDQATLLDHPLFEISPSLRATLWVLLFFGFLFIYEIIVCDKSYLRVASALTLLSGSLILIYTSIPFTNSLLVKKSLVHSILPIIGLETMTISSIGLYFSEKRIGIEALVKYIITVLISSSFIVIGTLLFFTEYNAGFLMPIATAFLVTGISMEIGLVPFHMWLPDISMSVPPSSIAYSVFVGDSSLIIFLAIFSVSLYNIVHTSFIAIMVILALFSMSIGEISALSQKVLRRMLGYSIISDAGYIIIGVIAESMLQMKDPWMVTFFVLTSNIAISSIYIILGSLEKDGIPITLDNLKGLYMAQPIAAILLSIFFLSMAGIPPFAGFYAKLYILSYLMETFEYWLGYVAAFFFLVCVAYSLLVIFSLASQGEAPELKNKDVLLPLFFSATFLLLLGLWPDLFYLLGGI
ncbi:MAG: hypothetical protein B6U76_09760 [Desulfurococcales archaeon ex4484_217_2]|nr:MAG: hypothetical protein B6U76_09760 [Desulfurococcales archaeon ex4484_217_2]